MNDALPQPGGMRIALLTGRSNPKTNALSAVQREFLGAVAPTGMAVTERGFPFSLGNGEVLPPVSILRASIANAHEFLRSQYDARYGQWAGAEMQGMIDATGSVLVLITGSCGLSILSAALPHLRLVPAIRVGVLAFGPVGAAPAALGRFRAVRGRDDRWSHALYRGPRPDVIEGGHMDYWTSLEAREIARAFAVACVRG